MLYRCSNVDLIYYNIYVTPITHNDIEWGNHLDNADVCIKHILDLRII